jgi:hypothetical protein
VKTQAGDAVQFLSTVQFVCCKTAAGGVAVEQSLPCGLPSNSERADDTGACDEHFLITPGLAKVQHCEPQLIPAMDLASS